MKGEKSRYLHSGSYNSGLPLLFGVIITLVVFILFEDVFYNILIILIGTILFTALHFNYISKRVVLFSDYFKVIRPFKKNPEIIFNVEIIEINYIETTPGGGTPFFEIRTMNKKKFIVTINSRKQAFSLIKYYLQYDFPIMLNRVAKSNLRILGVISDDNGIVLEIRNSSKLK